MKTTRSLHLLALVTILTTAASSQCAQAIYKSVGHQTFYGNTQTRTITTRGFFVFDPDTLRGTAVVGFTSDGRKTFTVVPLQNYRFEHVTGANNAAYTIIAKAESPGTQFAGT